MTLSKKFALTCLTLGSALAAPAPTQAAGIPIVGHRYLGRCNMENSLDGGYDYCGPDTDLGNQAADCALNEAMVACRNDLNADCVPGEATYRTIFSQQIVGYKACRAEVIARGYRAGR